MAAPSQAFWDQSLKPGGKQNLTVDNGLQSLVVRWNGRKTQRATAEARKTLYDA